MKGESIVVDRPDILIFEGINVLLPNRLPRDGKEIPFVSDFFDFSIFLDADTTLLEQWYIERFMGLRTTAFRDPRSYFRPEEPLFRLTDEATKLRLLATLGPALLPSAVVKLLPNVGLKLMPSARLWSCGSARSGTWCCSPSC